MTSNSENLREANAELAGENGALRATVAHLEATNADLAGQLAAVRRHLAMSVAEPDAIGRMNHVVNSILDELTDSDTDPRVRNAAMEDYDTDSASYLATGNFGIVSSVPLRDSDAVVAVKCLNNFNNTLSSEVLHANHNQEYTFALNHPHWALATVYNAWRGPTPDSLYANYDPDLLYSNDGISSEEAASNAAFFRSLHPEKTTVVTMELCYDSAARYPFERDINGNIPESEALVYAVELLSAVEHIASCGFAHMNITPSNMLVTAGRGGVEGEIQILLGGFGTITERSDGLERAVAGSMLMRAPEAIHVGGSNLGADVWAAGCALAMLVGDIRVFSRNQLVNPADHDACLEAELLPPLDTHPRLRALIRALVTIDINDRPSPREARALAEALLFEANFAKYRFLPDPRMGAAVFDRILELADETETLIEAGNGVPMMTYLEARMLSHNTADGLADALERARELVARETDGL